MAVVAIQAITQDGIISKAKEAREASQLAEEIEKINLAISEAKINSNYELTPETLSQTIQKYFGDDATVEGGTEVGYYLITVKGKNTYKIDLSGEILEQPGENVGGDTDGDDEGEEVLENTLVIAGYADGIISMEKNSAIYEDVINKLTGNVVSPSELECSSSSENVQISTHSTIQITANDENCVAELTIQHKTDKSLFAKITVYVGAPSSITISGYTSVVQGSTISLYADGDGSALYGNDVEWICDNTEIVTIQEMSGWIKVTGVSAGTVKIIAKSKINPNIYGETTITVNGAYTSPVVGPTEINISGPATGKVGESIYLSVNDGSGNMMYPDDITVTSYSAVRITKGSGCIWVTSSVPGSSIPITVTLNSNPSVSKIHYISFIQEAPVGPQTLTIKSINGQATAAVGETMGLIVEDEKGTLLYGDDVTWSAPIVGNGITFNPLGSQMFVSSNGSTGSILIRVTSNKNGVTGEIYISFY